MAICAKNLVFLVLVMGVLFPSCKTHPDFKDSGEGGENSHNHIQHDHPHEFVHVPLREDEPHSGIETHVVYMNLKKSAHFQCVNVDKPSSLSGNPQNDSQSQEAVKWFKSATSSKTSVDMSEECLKDDIYPGDKEDKDKENNKKCFFVYTNVENSTSQFYSTLRIRRVKKEDYGNYECRVNGKVVRRFVLRGELKATRKSILPGHVNETELSVIIEVGQPLHLYCNYSFQESNNYVNISTLTQYFNPTVTVTWFMLRETNNTLTWEEITKDLLSPEDGIFQNFETEMSDQFSGSATHDHRGEYLCSVNVKDSYIHEATFPVEYKFKVRVRDANRWMLPGGIVLVEIICMGIFTAIIWRRDAAKEVDHDELPQDSDDDGNTEEEESPKLK